MQLVDQWLGSNIAYNDALALQESKLKEVLDGTSPNTFFQLEHAPVYTIGRTRDKSSLRNPAHLPHPTIEINRGGQATYHGPGQLVGYPIVDLRPLGKDLHTYIRAIEQALIDTCNQYDIDATRRDGLTGVWVGHRKLASIGVGVRKWIGMHGFAINITKESLIGFLSITPCGLDGVKITCVEHEAKRPISVQDFAKTCSIQMQRCLSALETPTP
ncbi:lipoyl(octanoyl) transferase LipB [Rubritalea tangerina]|uniref:Octanoyltransferase n=1 Tax=Rubritalea tangerina TaxID=430798 RepID=A0ABW4Z7M5_9BACT